MAPPENNFHKNVQQKSIFIPFASYRRKENYHIYLKGISAFLSDSEECKIQRILELLPHQTSQDYILQFSEDSLETSPSVKHLIKFVETNLSNNDLYKPHYNQLLQDLRRTRHNPNIQNSFSKLIEECLDKAKVLDEHYYEQLAIDQIIMSIPIELQIKICINPTRPSLEDVKTVLTKEDRKRRILNYKSNTEIPKPPSNPTATNKNKDTSSQSTPLRFVPSDTIKSMEDGFSSCFGEITLNDLKITTSASLDSGAGNNYISQAFFDSLPLSVQSQLDPNVKILVTNAHGGKSLTKGAIDLKTSLAGCEKLQHQKLRFLLDPLSDVVTIGMKTLKEFSVNIFECEKVQQAPKENVPLNTLNYDEQIDHVCSVLAKEDGFDKFLKDNPKAYDKDQLLQPKIFTSIRLSKDYRPKRFPILPIKSHLIDKVKEKVEEEVRRGIVRKVTDKFGGERSFAVIVDNGPNKDPRICLALLNINKYTELKPYVLPKIRDLTIFNKSNFNVVSVLDISGAFNTIGLEDDSIPLTRFGLPFGIYEYVRLPFGWKKSPEIWIEVITKLLQPVESEKCSLTIYMDDLLLRSHVSDHGKLLRQIINILMNHNIQISLYKCKFFADSVPYLGFNYSISQGLSIPIDTVSGIVNLKVPSNRDELKRTLASLNYFSSNVAGFSMMAAEFYSMLSNKDSPRSTFCWDQVTTNKFKKLLTSFAKAIALNDVPSDITNTLLYPVANLNAISVIIAVKNSTNDISIIGIHNRVLKSYEKRYSLDQKLLVASIESLQLYSPVTTMYPVDIKVDSTELINLMKSQPLIYNAQTKAQKLLIQLYPYDLSFSKKDRDCQLPDSILKTIVESSENTNQHLEEDHLRRIYSEKELPSKRRICTLQELVEAYKDDPQAKLLLEYKINPNKIALSRIHPTFRPHVSKLSIEKVGDVNIIYLNSARYIPASLIPQAVKWLHRFHSSPSSTLRFCHGRIIFQSMSTHITQFYDECSTCMENCRNRNQIISSWPIPIMARERVHGDIFFFDSRTFLVLTCAYSNFVAIYHLNSMFASELVKKIDCYINTYSLIRILITDGGTPFRSEEFQNGMIDRNIIHRLSIAYRSCSNGIVEKSIQTIKQILKKARSDGMSLQNSLIFAAEAVNNMSKGENTTARQLFLNEPSLDVDIILKYCPYETPFKKNCWFKYDKTSPWREGKVISKISKSLFKIKFEDKFHIRTIDSIKFKKGEEDELELLPEEINSNNDILNGNDLKKDDLNINCLRDDLPMNDILKDEDSNDDALSVDALSDVSKASTKTATNVIIEENNEDSIVSQKDVLKYIEMIQTRIVLASDGNKNIAAVACYVDGHVRAFKRTLPPNGRTHGKGELLGLYMAVKIAATLKTPPILIMIDAKYLMDIIDNDGLDVSDLEFEKRGYKNSSIWIKIRTLVQENPNLIKFKHTYTRKGNLLNEAADTVTKHQDPTIALEKFKESVNSVLVPTYDKNLLQLLDQMTIDTSTSGDVC